MFVRRIPRYLIELRAVRSLLEENCEVFDRVGLVVRRMLGEMIRYLIELRAVRTEFVRVARYPIELGVVRIIRRSLLYKVSKLS